MVLRHRCNGAINTGNPVFWNTREFRIGKTLIFEPRDYDRRAFSGPALFFALLANTIGIIARCRAGDFPQIWLLVHSGRSENRIFIIRL